MTRIRELIGTSVRSSDLRMTATEERAVDRVAALAEREFGARLAALPQVKFLAPLLPEETAELTLEEVAPQRLRFRISRGDDAIASGEVRLA